MNDNATINPELVRRLLLLVSFIEGGAVMVIELLGAKIIAPYYGTSLYVWSSVLGVTLGALALGYFIGGYLSSKHPHVRTLFIVLLIGAVFTAITPLIAPAIMRGTDSLGVRMGSLISVIAYLLIPLMCMGCVSPLIIQQINKTKEESGKTAGTVYSISTMGGILATFLAGFYFIPTFGIKLTAFLTAGALGLLSLSYFFLKKNNTLILTIGLILISIKTFTPDVELNSAAKVVYNSTGILGVWEVLDFTLRKDQNDQLQTERKLLLNGIDQTYTQIGFEPLSLWEYIHKIAAYTSIKPPGSKALLMGMGGGSLAYELLAMGFDLDIVEIDGRIKHIAEEYFNYDPKSSNLYIDDARHFINSIESTYDVIVMDVVLGEVQPTHILSLEGFQDIRAKISDDAIIIVNFQGTLYDKKFSLGPRSVYKTMEAAGFNVNYFTKPQKEGEPIDYIQDIFLIGSPSKINFKSVLEDPRYNEWFPYADFYYEDLISEEELDLSDAIVLRDDKPILELLNASAILQWRRNKIDTNIKSIMRSGVPLIH